MGSIGFGPRSAYLIRVSLGTPLRKNMAFGKLKFWLSHLGKPSSNKDSFCCPICRGALTARPSADYPTFFCHRCGAYTLRIQQAKEGRSPQIA